jgi:UDP-2-acetamido-3-amino-2,3-dideoxy-glucuronate N-acetyltransferase
MSYFKHPQAIVESEQIGINTRICAFAHILPNAIVGEDCNICDHVFIENDVRIGNRVTIKCGVQLWDGTILENDVFIGPNATFTNDSFPRSRQWQKQTQSTIVKAGASVGANATILPGISIGQAAMIGAGAVVTHDVPPNAIVLGNPAYITGYVNSIQISPREAGSGNPIAVKESNISGIIVKSFSAFEDMRGHLSVGNFASEVPFVPKRYFIVHKVPTRKVRGEHAHRKCQLFLVCIAGECRVVVDDGFIREEYELNDPNVGIYIPPMIWGTQYSFSADAALLVFASEPYNSGDYIRDYSEFLKLKNEATQKITMPAKQEK